MTTADVSDDVFICRETRLQQFAIAWKAERAQHSNGIPTAVREQMQKAYGLSRAEFFRLQKKLLRNPDAALGQRKVRKGTFVITQEVHQYFDPHRYPDLKDVHKAIKEHYKGSDDIRVPSYEQFTRICKYHAPTDYYRKKRRGNKRGSAAQSEILDHSTQAGQVWHFDAKCLRAPVAQGRKTYERESVYVLSVWDHRTGMWLAFLTVLGRLTAAHVCLVLAMAARNAGGIAHTIVCDNAGEQVAETAVKFIEGARSRLRRIPSHMSWINGKAEQPHKMIEKYAKTLPGHSRGPQDLNGDIPQPSNHAVVTAAQVVADLTRLRDTHNSRRSRTRTASPTQLWDAAYLADELHLIEVADSYLASYAAADPYKGGTPRGSKTIADVGVQFTRTGEEARSFWCEYFQGKVHITGAQGHPHRVRLRYWPDDPDVVEVFNLRGEWRGTAHHDPDATTRAKNAARNGVMTRVVRDEHQAGADAGAATIDTATPRQTVTKVDTRRTTRKGADAVVLDAASSTHTADATSAAPTKPATPDVPDRPLRVVPEPVAAPQPAAPTDNAPLGGADRKTRAARARARQTNQPPSQDQP